MATKKSNFQVQTTFTAKDKNLIKTYNNIDKRARALQKTMGSVKTAMATVVGGIVVKNLADMSGEIDRAIVNFDKLAMKDQGLKQNMFKTMQDSIKDMNMSVEDSIDLFGKLSRANFKSFEGANQAAKSIDKTLMIMGSTNKGQDATALLEVAGAMLQNDKNDPAELQKLFSNISAASMSGTFTATELIDSIKYSATTARESGMSQENYLGLLAGLSEIGIKGSSAGTMLSNMVGSLQQISADRDLQANLNSMGLNTRNADGSLIDPMEFQKRIFELFEAKNYSGEQKAQFINKVFGATGADALKDLFNKTPEELAKVSQAIEKYTSEGQMQMQADYFRQQLSSQMNMMKGRIQQIGIGLFEEGSPLNEALKKLTEQINNLLGAVLSDSSVSNLMERIQEDLSNTFGNIDLSDDLLVKVYEVLKQTFMTLGDIFSVIKSLADFFIGTADVIDKNFISPGKTLLTDPGQFLKDVGNDAKYFYNKGKEMLGLGGMKEQDTSTITPNVNVNSNFDVDNNALRETAMNTRKQSQAPNLMTTGFAQ